MNIDDSSEDVEVLVVGAGPVGLALAADLARRGVRTKIIDKSSEPSTTSKAFGVQAGTLEQLENNFGSTLTHEMILAGHPTQEAFLHVDNNPPIHVDLSTIKSRFNYILILAQSETERILNQALEIYNCKVERNAELVHIEQSATGTISTLRQPNGTQVRVNSTFVIGCDGAHSAVRRLLKIPFEGDMYSGTFLLGDVELEWPWSYNTVRNFVSQKGVMATFPMKGDRKYRLVLIPKVLDRFESGISLPEFSKIAEDLCPGPIKIKSATWLTPFRVHHRIAKKFRIGRVLLAGDAAHIHSPAGGQGMNIGIQDSFNLSFKLFQVLRKGAQETILDNYEKERRPVALSVLKGTDRVFRLALLQENFLIRFGRSQIFPLVARNRHIQRKIVDSISEVKSARQEVTFRGVSVT